MAWGKVEKQKIEDAGELCPKRMETIDDEILTHTLAVRIGDFKYRFIDQPNGWLGGTVKVDWPILVNLRLNPFERTGISGSLAYYNWFAYEFWRFVFVK